MHVIHHGAKDNSRVIYKGKERFVSNFRNVLENILNIYLKMLIGDRLLDLVWMIWIWGEYRDEYMVVRILYFDFGI